PDAVDAAVADMADPGAFGPQGEGGAGGAHAGELAVLLAALVNARVRFEKCLPQGSDRPFLGVLGVDVRDAVHRGLAGQLADGVSAHAVGNKEEVAALLPLSGITGGQDRVVVLVVTTL